MPLVRESIETLNNVRRARSAVSDEALMNRIRDFLYRSPRFNTQMRMDLILRDSVFLGTCTNLSESGLRGTFSESVPTGAEGLITLYHQEKPFQMRAKIYSIRDGEARVRFTFGSDKERAAMAELITALSPRVRR